MKQLDAKNQDLHRKHNKIVEEQAKTLERVDELWKQKWKINWDSVSACAVSSVSGRDGIWSALD